MTDFSVPPATDSIMAGISGASLSTDNVCFDRHDFSNLQGVGNLHLILSLFVENLEVTGVSSSNNLFAPRDVQHSEQTVRPSRMYFRGGKTRRSKGTFGPQNPRLERPFGLRCRRFVNCFSQFAERRAFVPVWIHASCLPSIRAAVM